jgi:peroxiredoxin
VIDPDGVIREIIRRVKPGDHDELVLGALRQPG